MGGENDMHKVLLVEDEQIVRLALKSLVDWEKYHMDINYEASNGKEALKILEEHPDIDIMLTDINMPIMDGIELIQHVRKSEMNPEVVVLSAYDDYDLVRSAFKLGVNDYILKPQMEPDKILELFLKLIEKKDRNMKNSRDNIKKRENKNRILKALIDGNLEYIQTDLSEAEVNIKSKNIVASFLWIDEYMEIEKRYTENTLQHFMQGVCNIISQAILDYGSGEIICISPEEYIIVISNETSSINKVRNDIRDILDKVRHALYNYMNIKVTIGISSTKDDFENIHTLFEEAKQHAGYRYILGKGRNIYPEDIENIKFIEKTSLIGKEKLLLNALKALEKEKVLIELSKLFEIIGRFDAERIEDTFQYYLELIFSIMQYLRQTNQGITNIFDHNTDFYKIINKFETHKEIQEWIQNLIINILDFLIDHKNDNISKIVRMAQIYIQQNYMRKISLSDVSEHVGLSEGYFSKLFTKELETTFIEYLTEVRIEKAKVFLKNHNKKIYEICEEVGYESVEHFSRIFKKYSGLSPKKYQKIAK